MDQEPTRQSRASRLLDLGGPLLRRLHLGPSRRSGQSLLAAAVGRARCDDWGDGPFREGLESLLDALRHDRHLRLTAWADIHEFLIGLLVNRLLIRQYQQRNPACLHEPIDRPIFILGLPRSGTTLLYRLLALDPASRFVPYWESLYPAPLPDEPPGDVSPRLEATRQRLRRGSDLFADMPGIHAITADAPEECLPLLMNSFVHGAFVLLAPVGRYLRWVARQGLTGSYGYYRQQLQILQCRLRRRQWVLKAPLHVEGIEALLAVFPDARIIQTHRDPARTVPSTASYVATSWTRFRRRADLPGLGQGVLDSWAGRMERFLAVRDRAVGVPFVDVLYDRLCRDPVAVVGEIYARLGLEYTPAFEASMRDFLTRNPQGKHGQHRYSLEQFGLSRPAVEARFAGYCRRFGVTSEP
jgi:hypothetical protein